MKYVLVLLVIASCSKKKLDQEAAADKIGEYTTAVCACKTKACAQKVNAELESWTREMSEQLGEDENLEAPLALQNRVVDDLNKFSRCLTTAMTLPE